MKTLSPPSARTKAGMQDAGPPGHMRGRPTREFPVNFVTQRPSLLFRAAEGTKLLSAAMNDRVAFEVNEHNVEKGWSVIVKGRTHVLSSSAEIERPDRAQRLPWTPTVKRRYVRIIVSEVTDRRFRFGTEPDYADTITLTAETILRTTT